MGVAWLVHVAHGTEEGMEPDDLLCSRNARPQKGRGNSQTILLARRGRTIGMCSLDARSEGQSGCPPPLKRNERAWKGNFISENWSFDVRSR